MSSTKPSQPEDIGPGAILGSYRVVSLLAQGGMGVVFVAEHEALGRRVALKVLRPECSSDPDTVTRFFNEARAVNRIGHEHIVDITDFGKSPSGASFYVMELLAGESLAQRITREGEWPLDRALHVGIQIADALGASHAVGVVHRDLKPDNVFLINRHGDPDYVKLFDFGVAKLLNREVVAGDNRTPSRDGVLIGTPHYMSPEQARGHSGIDHRTDIYSLGVLLYRLVTGRVPFTAAHWVNVLLMHAKEPFPSVIEVRPDLPEVFDQIVQRAVEKDRGARWQTMAELKEALCGLVEEAPRPAMGGVRGTNPRLYIGGLPASRPLDEESTEDDLPASEVEASIAATGEVTIDPSTDPDIMGRGSAAASESSASAGEAPLFDSQTTEPITMDQPRTSDAERSAGDSSSTAGSLGEALASLTTPPPKPGR